MWRLSLLRAASQLLHLLMNCTHMQQNMLTYSNNAAVDIQADLLITDQ